MAFAAPVDPAPSVEPCGVAQTPHALLLLFSDDPDSLPRAHEQIRAWLRGWPGLTLKPKRGRVLPTTQPTMALGYRISWGGLNLGRAARRQMRARLRKVAARGGWCWGDRCAHTGPSWGLAERRRVLQNLAEWYKSAKVRIEKFATSRSA